MPAIEFKYWIKYYEYVHNEQKKQQRKAKGKR